MEKLSPIDKIDRVLFLFPPNDKIHAYPKKTINDLLVKGGLNIDDRELIEILIKLVDDGYLRIDTGDYYTNGKHYKDIPLYFLTFTGELFHLTGGYTQRLNDAKSVQHNQDECDRMARIYETRLLWATRFAGIGACALVLWEIIKWLFHHELWHLPF
jgi:hypothetical protein